MKCLYCNKDITENNNEWHELCIKKFFNVDKLPIININENEFESNILELFESKSSIQGVQRKLSLHLYKNPKDYRLTLIGFPKGYILKPNPKEIKNCAISEKLVMDMANKCGIKTPKNSLIRLSDGTLAYIIERMDRIENEKIHMEDFQQLSNRPSEYKYSSSYEKCAKIIDEYSTMKELDKIQLFYRIIFSFVTLNSDMHLKNFSLIYKDKEKQLSNAYDLLPVNLLIEDKDELALTLNGKKRNLRKNDFIKYGINVGLNIKQITNMINKLFKYKNDFFQLIDESRLNDEMKEKFKILMNERFDRIKI